MTVAVVNVIHWEQMRHTHTRTYRACATHNKKIKQNKKERFSAGPSTNYCCCGIFGPSTLFIGEPPLKKIGTITSIKKKRSFINSRKVQERFFSTLIC